MKILLVTLDCLRRDRCGTYGYHRDTTPTLDALGQNGVVFDNAYATGPVTTESFPGILAGRLSAQTVAGDNLWQKCLADDAPTIASHLSDEGWDTGAVISNPRIGVHVHSDRGFAEFRNLRTPDSDSDDDTDPSLLPDFAIGQKLYQLREQMRDFDSLPYRYEIPFLGFRYYQYLSGWPSVRGETIVNEFLELLSRQSTPFFGWTHLMDIHGPIHPQTVTKGGLSDGRRFTQFRSQAKRVSNIYNPRTEARYDSAVRYVDEQLRRIVDWLKSNDFWDETTLIVTADHGEELHDRGAYGHPQHCMYDELLKIPLIIRTPGREGERVNQPFSLGWLHEIISELSDVSELEVPLSSSKESHFASDSTESEVILADSISPRGHSVAAQRGEARFVIQTGEMTDAEEIEVGPQGFCQLGRSQGEQFSQQNLETTLEQAANQVTVDPEDLRREAGSSSVGEATIDQLKQLGYTQE
jgi:choline-sulfatase